jgi:hypothetical protein
VKLIYSRTEETDGQVVGAAKRLAKIFESERFARARCLAHFWVVGFVVGFSKLRSPFVKLADKRLGRGRSIDVAAGDLGDVVLFPRHYFADAVFHVGCQAHRINSATRESNSQGLRDE